jgi:hypothetical protein
MALPDYEDKQFARPVPRDEAGLDDVPKYLS